MKGDIVMSENKMGFDPIYDDNKKSDVWILGKKQEDNDKAYRKVETIIDYESTFISEKSLNKVEKDTLEKETFNIKDEVVLFETPTGQQKIHAWLLENSNTKYINSLHISRRTNKGVYGSQEITLSGEAILRLKNFLNNMNFIDNHNNNPFSIPLAELDNSISKTERNYSHIINQDEFSELINANLFQIENFHKILSIKKMGQAIKKLEEIIEGDFINEVHIQKFLLDNLWMFGNDYSFIINDDKINTKNILDIIPKNFEGYIDVIEVKLPTEKLFNWDNSHNNLYCTSNLTKAIAQTQNYIFELEKMTIDERYAIKNECKIVKPKGIVLYGSKEKLNNDEERYLRILNSSYHNLIIITYQQLLEKAKNTMSFYEISHQ